MNEIFAKNIKALRLSGGLTQERHAALIGVTRSAYGAYEEGRAFPSAETLVRLAKVWHITDLIGFISNENFDVTKQIQVAKPKRPHILTLVQQAYEKAGIKDKLCVNILLGLVDTTD